MARKKIYTERFKKSYKAYRKRYFAKQRQFEKLNRRAIRRGEEKRYLMREDVLNKADYYAAFRAYKAELQERGIKNPNVNQYIVSDQAYERSRKQYRALMSNKERLMTEVGLDVSGISEIDYRTGRVQIDRESISNHYWFLREELGLSVMDAKEEISTLFYGSK